jgi:hypothetical protein
MILFALVTALWMSVEDRQGRGRGGLARFGRVAFALLLVTICVPMVVLMPLFWLDSQLPVDAGVTPLLAPAMTITLISLALIVLVNVADTTASKVSVDRTALAVPVCASPHSHSALPLTSRSKVGPEISDFV